MWIRGCLGVILATSVVLLEGTRKTARDFSQDLRVSEPGQTICCRCRFGGSELGYRQVKVKVKQYRYRPGGGQRVLGS